MTWAALILRLLILNLDLHFRSGRKFYRFNDVEIVREFERKKEKKKEIGKTAFVKKRERFRRERLKVKSTRPKDHRFSNQKMIRRMYRNC